MKFLHTSDWHLGIKTNSISRIAEQRKILEEILSVATYENIDCIIVSGDVFDSKNPSAEAEQLFYEYIEKLSDNGDRFIFILAGNHDSPEKIEAGLPLAVKNNIYLAGTLSKKDESLFSKNSFVHVVETGKGYVKIQANGETATIAYIPSDSIMSYVDKSQPELTYAEKFCQISKNCENIFSENTINIFVSHILVASAKTSNGSVSLLEPLAIRESDLPQSDYSALGHIHTAQKINNNTYYSGSIIKMSPNAKNQSINVISISKSKQISIKTQGLVGNVKYDIISAETIAEAKNLLSEYDKSDIVELRLKSSISGSELKELKKNYPCISSVTFSDSEEENKYFTAKKQSYEELFREYYKQSYGMEPDSQILKMLRECKKTNEENKSVTEEQQ